jgi:hypothetical protein
MQNSKLIPYPGFCGPGYNCTPQQAALGIDRVINLYPQANEVGTGKDQPLDMVARPGFVTFATPGIGQGRGLFSLNMTIATVKTYDVLAGCAGSKFFTVSSGGAVTVRGDINAGISPCIVFSNIQLTQVAILNTQTEELYVWNGTAVVAVTTPIPFYSMCYLDGFAYAVGGGNVIHQSGLNDFTTWAALDYASREDAPDVIQTLSAHDDTLMAAGRETTSFFYNAGVAGFALAKIQHAFIEEGIGAPFSIAKNKLGSVMATRGQEGFGQVMVARTGTVDRISTHAIEFKIQRASSMYDLLGAKFQIGGHNFYSLYSRTGNFNLWYSFRYKCWLEVVTNATAGEAPAFFVSVGVDAGSGAGQGRNYAMRYSDGKIFKLDPTVTADEGSNFTCRRIAPVMYHLGDRFSINRFRLDQQIGDSSGPLGAGLKMSYDGGNNWDAAYDTQAANPVDGTVEWRQLGQAGQTGFAVDVLWSPAGASLTVNGANLKIRQDA